jgi:hypothetical protein
MDYQEYMVLNEAGNSKVYFVSRAFKSALSYAKEYINRNKSKFPMGLYQRNKSRFTSKTWIFVDNFNP